MADILLITSWDTACGIAEHSAMLKDAVESQSHLRLDVHASGPQPPHPSEISRIWGNGWPIIHLNYHAALHAPWSPDWIRAFQDASRYQTADGRPVHVVITYHDTGVPNSDQCKALYDVADDFIVHEPAADLPGAHYWRMGVPDPVSPMHFGTRSLAEADYQDALVHDELPPHHRSDDLRFKAYDAQPVLGTIGFPFPWKHYDQLARVTRDCGWALVLIAPNATQDQVNTWRAINGSTLILTDFTPHHKALSILTGCDATAFTYVCHNTGQSGAVLQGIAARKPVIALKTCRQFRALYADPLGNRCIRWAETFEDVAAHLRTLPIQRIDPRTVALAEQESWRRLGRCYIDLYQELL